MLKATIKKWQEGVDAYKAGNIREAQNCFQAIDDMSKILYNLGVVLVKQNNYGEAVSVFTRAVKCDPFLAIAYFMKGCACHLKGDITGAVGHYDAAIQALRGHEFIDYKQLGMDYKLLLCEILVNKAMCLSKSGGQLAVPQLMRDATSCKAVRDEKNKFRFDDVCNALATGTLPPQPYTVPLELMFLPPKIKTERKPAASTADSPAPTRSREAPTRTEPPARQDIPARPSSEGSAPGKYQPQLPAVPTRQASQNQTAKKLPPRPISLKVADKVITIKCFYKDRRLIQISSSEPNFDDLQEKIRAKFQVDGLLINYKTSSGDLQPLKSMSDLRTAISDDLHEIYLNLRGEVNEFAPAPAPTTARASPARPTPALSSPAQAGPAQTGPALPARNNFASSNNVKPQSATPASSSSPSTSSVVKKFNSNPTTTTTTKATSSPTTTSPANKLSAQKALVAATLGAPLGKQQKKQNVWQECYTEDGEKYFYNTETQETSWDPDIDPSPPWLVCYTDAGDKYYYNPDTDGSTWEFPG